MNRNLEIAIEATRIYREKDISVDEAIEMAKKIMEGKNEYRNACLR